MASVDSRDSRAIPTRAIHDPSNERVEIAVDVAPADPDDCTVAVGPDRVVIECEDAPETYERVVSPPSPRHVFDGKRRATYNNGVLSVSLETDRRVRGPIWRTRGTHRARSK